MSAPDPKGCARCGLVTCTWIRDKDRDFSGVDEEAFRRQSLAWHRQREACESRHAVDWQAECRRRDERLAMATAFEGDGFQMYRSVAGTWVLVLRNLKPGLREGLPTADAAFAALDAATKGQTDG